MGLYFYRMKKLIGLGLLAAIIGLTACNNNDTAQDGYKTYSSDSLGLEIEYPTTFETKVYFNQFIPISFFEVREDTLKDIYPENVLVNFEPIPMDIPFKDYLQGSRTQLKLLMPEPKIYDEDSLSIDGMPAGVYKFDRPKADSTNFTSKMYVIKDKDRAINFSCTALSSVFPFYEPVFDRIVNSVKFKK